MVTEAVRVLQWTISREVTMIVAAHQPNFAPWLGFFDRIRRAQRFVLLDHVQFERQNYQNRTLIKTQGGPKWVTVPVVQKSRDELILDKEICNGQDGKEFWGRKVYLTLESSYARAPHFKLYGPKLKELFVGTRWDKLVDLNLALLRLCLESLQIATPLVRSSELQGLTGAKSELVLSMVRAAGGTTYMAGMGGSKEYLDAATFKEQGVDVAWQDFSHPEYPQLGAAPFAKGLSVLDLLFNCGPESRAVLEKGGACTRGRAAA